MKKALFVLSTMAIAAFTACQKEVDNSVEDNTPVVGTTLHAVVENGVDTKVSADAAGNYKWQASDKIAVLDDSGAVHEFTASSAAASSEFTCTSTISLGKYAAYPYSDSFTATGDAVTFYIPSTITYSADATNMPMLGKINAGAATFKAVGGMMKLIVYGVPTGATTLTFTAKAQKINGAFSIADASVASPVIATAAKGTGDDSITINFAGKYAENMVFYIPLPTGTIEGFSIAFNDAGATTKSVDANVVVGRNGIILAPTLNLVTPQTLLNETFGTQNGEDTYSMGSYNNSGTTVYGGGSVTYSTSGTVTLYTTKHDGNMSIANSPKTNELLIGSSSGVFTINGIPTAGAANAVLSFQSNKNTTTSYTVSSSTTGVTVQTLTTSQITGSSNPFTITLNISGLAGKDSFNLSFSNTSASNSRIDNILIRTSAPSPTITFTGTGTRTIAAGSLAASDVVGVSLTAAVDGTGIGISSNVSWLSASLSGTTLSITASEYNHSSIDREGIIYLKATGAETKTITVTQKPSVVDSPTLTATPGDKSFTVSWTPDTKAASYVAYYSTTDNMADPTLGTELTVDDSSTPYTVEPDEDLTNGTTYYVYVKVNSIAPLYSPAYIASSTWAKVSVTPTAGVVTKTFSITSGDVVSNSGYAAYSATVSSRGWLITYGGNNKSVGTNSKRRSNCNLSSYTKYAVDPVTSSMTASAFANTTSISKISKIKYEIGGGSNQSNTNVYLLYSSNNTSFSKMSLTSGTQGDAISSGTTFEFTECTGYFAVLFVATNDSGDWRIDDVTLTFTYSD